MDENFIIVSRFCEPGNGWRKNEYKFFGDYLDAGRYASKIAQEMDEIWGDSHFWTVDLYDTDSNSSYYQFFHGRTS